MTFNKEITYNVFHLRTGQRHVVESTGPRAAIIEVAKSIGLTVKKRVNEKFIVNGLLYTIDRWNSDWQGKYGIKISEKRNSEEVAEFFNRLLSGQDHAQVHEPEKCFHLVWTTGNGLNRKWWANDVTRELNKSLDSTGIIGRLEAMDLSVKDRVVYARSRKEAWVEIESDYPGFWQVVNQEAIHD